MSPVLNCVLLACLLSSTMAAPAMSTDDGQSAFRELTNANKQISNSMDYLRARNSGFPTREQFEDAPYANSRSLMDGFPPALIWSRLIRPSIQNGLDKKSRGDANAYKDMFLGVRG